MVLYLLLLYVFESVNLPTIAGTDEDLPQSHWSRMPRGGVFGTGDDRAAMMYDETDMEVEIHRLEQEAYSSVLRAFKAQADTITWVLLFRICF